MNTGATSVGREAPLYEHTQRGRVIVVIAIVTAALIVGMLLGLPIGRPDAQVGMAVSGVVVVVLAATAVVFSSLTVRVTPDVLTWGFGRGMFGGRIRLAEIASAVPTRTPLWAGLGIHWIGRGWVYNVSGRGAVMVVEEGGKTTWVGSDEPEALAAAIERARGG